MKLKKEYDNISDKIFDIYLYKLAKDALSKMDKNELIELKKVDIKFKYILKKKQSLKWYQIKKKNIYKKIIKKYILRIRKNVKKLIEMNNINNL